MYSQGWFDNMRHNMSIRAFTKKVTKMINPDKVQDSIVLVDLPLLKNMTEAEVIELQFEFKELAEAP